MDTSLLRSKAPATPKDNNLVKIAVEMAGKPPQLIEFNQKQPLPAIIQELCNYWNLPDPETYALRFNNEASRAFVSDKNRMEVKNGHVLQLGFSPAKITEGIVKMLSPQSVYDDKLKAVHHLVVYATDPTFTAEFVDKQGMEMIIGYVENLENGKISDQIGALLLPAFVDLMDHGLTQWDILESTFIKKIASFINNQSNAQDPRTLQAALSILESLVQNSTTRYSLVEKELTIPNLSMHLQNSSPAIQQNTLALINALFSKADDSKRMAMSKTLNTRQIRNSIVMSIIQGNSTALKKIKIPLFYLLIYFLDSTRSSEWKRSGTSIARAADFNAECSWRLNESPNRTKRSGSSRKNQRTPPGRLRQRRERCRFTHQRRYYSQAGPSTGLSQTGF